jgi:hypothetical protein
VPPPRLRPLTGAPQPFLGICLDRDQLRMARAPAISTDWRRLASTSVAMTAQGASGGTPHTTANASALAPPTKTPSQRNARCASACSR